LSERRGRRVRIFTPQRGQKRDLIDLVEKNAKIAFEQRFRILKPDMERVLEDLQELLEIPRFPARIESFDISHIQGAENVAGMVVFENGKMNRAEYRRFRIKTVEGANDFASMQEAVFRRYRRQLDEGKPLPDLIMIDGGKGQLSAAAQALRDLDLEAIPMVGVVKPPRRHNEISHLLVKGREHEPVYLDPHSAVFRLVHTIRDETHRTAVEYHRKRRELRDFTSELTAIPGVGEKRKNRLLRNLGSIQRIANASVAELTPFVGKKTAEDIVEHFNRQRALAGVENASEGTDVPGETGDDVDEIPHDEAPTIPPTDVPEPIENNLIDPEGDAEDLRPIRSVDHEGNLRPNKRHTRKRGERSNSPHSIKRDRIGKEEAR
jgi:excinuclease ABC subunit C